MVLGMKLREYDLAICRPFAFKVTTHTTDAAFKKTPYAFPTEPPTPTLDGIQSRVASLAGIEPQFYECCIKSCCAYTGKYKDMTTCPFCKEPRYANKKARKRFTYIPLIPRLQAFAGNKTMAEKMKYRGIYKAQEAEAGKTKDIFDGEVYKRLCRRCVHVGQNVYGHYYFSDDRDVALGISTDGVFPHRRRKTTCWPLIIFDYNLPPDIRFHLEHILSLGVIPGPLKPHDIDSFLWPLLLELEQLAIGVKTFDALSSELFMLRAYLIVAFGDIPAVAMLMKMKGHNGISPCRMCNIRGLRVPNQPKNTAHCVPHERSVHPDVLANPDSPSSYDVQNLPLRTHSEFMLQAADVETAPCVTEADRRAKKYGIKGLPALANVDSLIFPTSFPYDFMRLIWENLMKNLLLHWTGDFKGLGPGCEDYELSETVWDAIGVATANTGSTIPSAYGNRVPNISADRSTVSAEMWSFWTLYLGPILLRNAFKEAHYFDHFVALVRLLNRCLQFEIADSELDEMESGFIEWVEDYER